MRYFFLLLLLFLSEMAFADIYGNRNMGTWTAQNAALSACNALKAEIVAEGNHGTDFWWKCRIYSSTAYETYNQYAIPHSYDRFYFAASCPSGQYEQPDNSCSTTPPPPTDAECQARSKIYHQDASQSSVVTVRDENNIIFDGCHYAFEPSNNAGCGIDETGLTFCFKQYTPTSTASGAPSGTNTADPTAVNESAPNPTTSGGGTKDTSSSSTPPVVESDTPTAGDTTTTQTKTDSVNYSDSVKIDNASTTTTIDTVAGGNITKTTTTTTVQHADGSTSVTTSTSYNQTAITQTKQVVDWVQGTSTTSEKTTSATSSNSSSTTTTGTDGSSTTTTTGENGKGERGEGDGDKFGDFTPSSKDDLYTKDETLTYESVFNNFTSSVNSAPAINAATNFFNVNVSGSCPVWTIPAFWVFPAIVIDAQCSSAMNQVWPFIAAVLILCSSFLAFRWAFL